jgi:hypothetical protein
MISLLSEEFTFPSASSSGLEVISFMLSEVIPLIIRTVISTLGMLNSRLFVPSFRIPLKIWLQASVKA